MNFKVFFNDIIFNLVLPNSIIKYFRTMCAYIQQIISLISFFNIFKIKIDFIKLLKNIFLLLYMTRSFY